MKSKFLYLSLLLTLLLSLQAKAQMIAVESNALMLGAMMPNLGCELVMGERSTFSLSGFMSENCYGFTMKTRGIQPEYRYWLSGRPMTREFIGIGALAVSYHTEPADHIYKGDAAGLGFTFGYALNLSKRWNVTAYGSCGWVYFSQLQYYTSDNPTDFYVDGVPQSNAKGCKIMPIKLGVSLQYIIK